MAGSTVESLASDTDYSSADEFCVVSDNDKELDSRVNRKVYFITYSDAKVWKCSSKQEFAELVLEAFFPPAEYEDENVRLQLIKQDVAQWAVCKELHKDVRHHHYHMAIKFNKNRRWLSAKRYLGSQYSIEVNFVDKDTPNYVAAFRYLGKGKTLQDLELSDGHPPLTLNAKSPPTSKANRKSMAKRRAKEMSGSSSKGDVAKVHKLSKLEVMDLIVSHNIRDEDSLLALAVKQAKEGLMELKKFIADTPERVYNEIISKTWKMQQAEEKMARKQQSRMERLAQYFSKACPPGCRWLVLAEDVLKKNHINKEHFSEALKDLLENGRGKNRNILLTGPSNCGKTFLLAPIEMIYDTFSNPGTCKYAFVGCEGKEVFFLNDLRWNQDMIAWQELLNLLEGATVRLPAPKNIYAQDIVISTDVPIFATSIDEVTFAGRSNNVSGENEMMRSRWRHFKFHYKIPAEERVSMAPCGRCFAELVMSQPTIPSSYPDDN